MHQCSTCDLWLPTGHAHNTAECAEHIRQGRIIKARADVWRRRYAVRSGMPEQLALDIDAHL